MCLKACYVRLANGYAIHFDNLLGCTGLDTDLSVRLGRSCQ